MSFDFQNYNRIFHWRALAVPSPLNGERVRVRGGRVFDFQIASSVLAGELVSAAKYFPDAAHATASRTKSSRAQSAHPSIANSKTAASGCFAFSNMPRVACPSPVVPGIRAGRRPVPDCSVPRRRKNRDNVCRLDADAGICRRKSAGRAESPTTFFPPRWIFSARHGKGKPDSLRNYLTGLLFQFKRLFSFSPLTLTLSPLRGEGMALDNSFDSTVSPTAMVKKSIFCKQNSFTPC